MKKSILAAGISLLLVFPGAAAEPTTLNGRMERVEDVLYGETRSGSLTERITSADNLIYGTGSSTGVGLDDRVGNLYADVVNSGNDAAPSISSRTNALEYYLTDEIKREPLAGRIGDMEKSVFGSVKSGALDKRTAELEKAILLSVLKKGLKLRIFRIYVFMGSLKRIFTIWILKKLLMIVNLDLFS